MNKFFAGLFDGLEDIVFSVQKEILGVRIWLNQPNRTWIKGINPIEINKYEGIRVADINKDGYVDFFDYSLLADQWLMSGVGLSADIMPIESDEIVDIFDLTLIANHWLAGIE